MINKTLLGLSISNLADISTAVFHVKVHVHVNEIRGYVAKLSSTIMLFKAACGLTAYPKACSENVTATFIGYENLLS